jgi:phage gpG-like protein
MGDSDLTYKINDTEVNTLFRKLSSNGQDLRPAMATIGEVLMTSIDKNFEAQGRYDKPKSWRGGTNKWRELSSGTKLGKIGGVRKGYTKGGIAGGRLRVASQRTLNDNKILQDSGQLAASITRKVTKDRVVVGTNKVYAAAHQFGVSKIVTVRRKSKTVFGTARSGHSLHQRHMRIPARPFIVVQDEDMVEIKEVLKDHILRGATGGSNSR